jgi:uncharacterized protein (DUF2235 family)
MGKNIVICADGTGNKFCNENSNVIKLYQCLDLSAPDRQIAYYHGGLGTLGDPSALSQWSKRWTRAKGLAFGYGLTRAISDIYTFLMETYEAGDQVYLFGFSRGAYTVRALAGMLHMFGLARPKDYNLIPYATEMLKAKQSDSTFQVAAEFKQTFSRDCKPYFVGVWDTVSSVGWVWDPLHVPYTRNNPDIAILRHAVSIDERRCFFRQNLAAGTNLKQVWFAGVHSDVGGGYPESQSGLAKLALEWMLVEACQAGLRLNAASVATQLGQAGGGFVAPDPRGEIHNSLKGAWLLLEPLPHRYVDTRCKPPETKIRFPLGRRRHIEEGVTVHQSVQQRIDAGLGYNPPNLPAKRVEEPWVRWNAEACGAGA